MAELTTSNGYRTLVDQEDYELFKDKTWYFDGRYVATSQRKPTRRTVTLHSLIMNTPKGMTTDHVNGDRLDNRRANLKVCTQAENNRGFKTLRRGSKSGVIGVSPVKVKVKWQNREYIYTYWSATINGRRLGMRKNLGEAIKLREEAYANLQAS